MRDLLHGAGNPAGFRAVQRYSPGSHEERHRSEALTTELCGLPSCWHLCHRASYGDAPDSGEAPQEIDTSEAAAEIESLCRSP